MANKLKNEQSLYLKQHENNPVHWYPYGEEAFQKAAEENKPIFMSIGYSACHWCHVMARESFQDQKTAEILNENFINIKVDREEYPEVDNYMQSACQIYTGTGGWPLSAFLTQDKEPFYVGTYFPKNPKENMPSFEQILRELSTVYKKDKDTAIKNANEVANRIKEGPAPKEEIKFEGHFPHPESILKAIDQFADKENGGYGAAPKFPQFSFYNWAIEQMLEGTIQKDQGGQHIIQTLEKMFAGGIHDHARGGFHRYSVDNHWKVPHFEKMLYDQAGLLKLSSKLSLVYPSPLVYDCLLNTLDYLEHEMLSEEGYFFSAQDAESEGEEGLFFTFSEEEFDDVIVNTGDEDLVDRKDEIKEWFDISKDGNFDQSLNVISLETTSLQELYAPERWEIIRKIRTSILNERKNRIPPKTDQKAIASWNFLIITSLVDVIQYCRVTPIKKRAQILLNNNIEKLIKTFCHVKENKTFIQHTNTIPNKSDLFEDYAMFAHAMMRVYEISANDVFKENLKNVLKFIQGEFKRDDWYSIKKIDKENQNDLLNLNLDIHDQSFQSPLATYLGVLRKSELLFPEEDELFTDLDSIIKEASQRSLQNPIFHGECLRSLTYPPNAYRILKIPSVWAQENRFHEFMTYMLPRFVIDYNKEEKDIWQVCNKNSCELKGVGLEDFIKQLGPQEKSPK